MHDKLVLNPKPILTTNFSFDIGDDVYIRPKSAKECGMSGRIVDISYKSTTKVNAGGATLESAPQRSKKRKLVEDARVSVQQHCFYNAERIKTCNTIKTGVRPSRLFPVYDICKDDNFVNQTQIIITPDTINYRQLGSSHLRSTDKVLEIGCSTGECTALLLRRLALLHMHKQRCEQRKGVGKTDDVSNMFAGKIVAFDVGSDVLEQAQTRLLSEINSLDFNDEGDIRCKIYSQLVQLQKVDAIADPKRAYSFAMVDRKPDIILIDIGGNRELTGIVRMIQWVQTAFENDPPRVVIVKSELLVEEFSKEGERESSPSKNASISAKTLRLNVTEHGVIEHAQHWFSSLAFSFSNKCDDEKCSKSEQQSIASTQKAPKYSHPVKAPMALSPKDNVTPICRFHNYHPDGCKRRNGGRDCPYDHEHCHWCGQIGHVALNCYR